MKFTRSYSPIIVSKRDNCPNCNPDAISPILSSREKESLLRRCSSFFANAFEQRAESERTTRARQFFNLLSMLEKHARFSLVFENLRNRWRNNRLVSLGRGTTSRENRLFLEKVIRGNILCRISSLRDTRVRKKKKKRSGLRLNARQGKERQGRIEIVASRNKHDSISHQMRFVSKLLRSGMLCTNDFSAGLGTPTKG